MGIEATKIDKKDLSLQAKRRVRPGEAGNR
jgi:hypothetical protein